MLTKKNLSIKKSEKLYLPTIITFLVLHLNHMFLTLAQYSNKHYTFDFSDPTILNYLEGYSNKNSIFEYKGYPTANLQTYQPGPIPHIYIFKLSWLLNTYFDINPIYLSNILLVIYPTLLIIIASTILYKKNLKLLSIMTLSITWLVQYTNLNFNASNRGTERLDTGTDYITLIATLTLMMVILSYKNPNSSHLPLIAFSGLLLNNHFTAFALAPFTILYALYLIIISMKNKKYIINYKTLLPISIFIYLPLLYRFIVEPLYLYTALQRKSNIVSERLFPEPWGYYYDTTPLNLFINDCAKGANNYNNLPCLPYTHVKLSVIIFTLISLIVIYKLVKTQNILIKSIVITSFILINYITLTGFEPKHSSIASALFLAIIIYYLSKTKSTTTIALILILLFVNYLATGNYKYIGKNTYKKIEKENFSQSFINEIKNSKFKIDICYLSMDENCTKKLGFRKNTLLTTYSPRNYAQVTILEFLKNKIDICIIDKTGSENRINNLICTKSENKDNTRNELYLIRDYNFETPASIFDYTKIATVVNPAETELIHSDAKLLESLIHPGVGVYLRKDVKGVNPAKLSFLNHQVYENKLSTLNLFTNLGNNCTLNNDHDLYQKIRYCYKEDKLEFVILYPLHREKVDIYDPR